MCRLTAYVGAPRALADFIVRPAHSLLAQSQAAQEAKIAINGDGFGFAWYDQLPEPGLYKDTLPAWSDSNLLSLCDHIRSPLFLAHVRASTEGETARANCHPFIFENWSFMHNGQTGGFNKLRRPLEAILSEELYAHRRGGTDSEILFLLLLHFGLIQDPGHAFEQMIAFLYETAEALGLKPFFRLTCVLSDGTQIFAFRHASDGRVPTLYASEVFAGQGFTLASEPLDGRQKNWRPVEPDRLISFP